MPINPVWEHRLRDDTKPLLGLLDDLDLTTQNPDRWGGRWFETYRGSPLESSYIMVDFAGNLLHGSSPAGDPSRDAVITYIPAWLATVIRRLHNREQLEPTAFRVADLDTAAPMRFRLTQKRVAEPAHIGGGLTALPYCYDIRPSRAAVLTPDGWVESDEPTDEDPLVDSVHWTPPALRIVAAPGATIASEAVIDSWDLSTAQTIFQEELGATSGNDYSSQTLNFTVDRFQDPRAIPTQGGAWRRGTVGEIDLAASVSDLGDSGARFIEVTRGDGVDFVFLSPEAVEEINAPAPVFIETVQLYLNGILPESAAIPVRIRVDAESPEDRFAYQVTYIDGGGGPTSELPAPDADPPYFRLSVIRTEGVKVFIDLPLAEVGTDAVERLLDYREAVRPFDRIPPSFIDPWDEENDGSETYDLRKAELPHSEVWGQMVFDGFMLAIGLCPLPPTEVISTLYDLATLVTYLGGSTDPLGRKMTPADFYLTLGGMVLPVVSGTMLRTAKRMTTVTRIGDDAPRLMAELPDLIDEARDVPLISAAAGVP